MTDLVAKLEKLEGPDRAMDAEIATSIGGYVRERRGRDQKAWFYPIDGGFRRQINSAFSDRLPAYTASLDTAIALVERVLPGWDWSVMSFGEDGAEGKVWKHGWHDDTVVRAHRPTPAIALLIALLKAKEAQDG